MMQITFITVGTLKERYLVDGVAEYKKRMQAFAKVQEIELKEERIADPVPAQIAKALDAEAEHILACVPRSAVLIALCVEGKMLSTEELSQQLGALPEGKVALVIGSSHGLSDKVKKRANLCLSLSRLTFPHQLAKVLLFEVVYRCLTLLNGKAYHK